MYQKILVPLDGSKLAECALPHAIDMAKAYRAELVLVSVTEGVEGFRPVADVTQSTEEKLVPEASGKFAEEARKYLDKRGVSGVSLTVTGGLRISSDFAKALALGADAVAVSTSALVAIGCQQYRVCNTGKCPMGIATHDPDLRRRLNVELAAKQLENFLRVSTEELRDFARLTGNNDVHGLSVSDLCTTNSEISKHTAIAHV